jgi:hypothetical protein
MMRALLIGILLAAAVGAYGQSPQTAVRAHVAVLPRDISVGDVFHVAVRLDLPAGAALAAPDSLALPDDLEQAGRRSLRVDSAAGARRVTVVYPLTAWRPGSYTLPEVVLGMVANGTRTDVVAEVPPFDVRSVLPADTAGIEPQPAKDVLGANRLWWPILLGLLLLALSAVALYYWWRRRTPIAVAPALMPAIPPRAVALAQLDELQRSELLSRGELKRFYQRLTEVLRHYVASLDGGFGVDLTTSELSLRMRGTGGAEVLELVRILGAADLVKFARARCPVDTAQQDLAAARDWVERVPAESVPVEETDIERRVA